mgnify:CR=1 FL=1
MKMYNPPHPGLVLREYIEGMKIGEVAQKLGVSRISLSRILNGKTAITPEMATRIGLALNNSPSMWLGMQADYDLWHERVSKAMVKGWEEICKTSIFKYKDIPMPVGD